MEKINRRTFCKGAALALTAGAVASRAVVSSAEEPAVSKAVPDGLYTFTMRSELTQQDFTHDFYYSDSFFAHSAFEYDHKLALVTLGLALTASNSAASDVYYCDDADVGRQENLAAAFDALGFADAQYYHYDENSGRPTETVGYALACKTIELNGEAFPLVALIFRGAGYRGEWASNLHTGSDTAHAGFVAPVAEVFENLCAYLKRVAPENLSAAHLWIGSYSRGSAVANMVAARIHHELSEIAQENVFVYTFATPMALTANDRPDLQQDYDNNHAPDGSLKDDWGQSNIFNVLASGDIVTRVLPTAWGYHRNGNDRFLPATTSAEELADLNAMSQNFSSPHLNYNKLATAEDTDVIVQAMLDFFGSKENFHEKYEDVLMDMMECTFLRSEEEISSGHILTDEEVVERLRSLTHMGQFSWWRIVRSVWVASSMSRPILEKLGDNIPLMAQQIVVPILAVGLCYNIETDVLKLVVFYILTLVSSQGELDSFLCSAYCHHVEDYIILMEYYPPEAHGMAPFTRE